MGSTFQGKHRHIAVAEVVVEALKVFDKVEGHPSRGWKDMPIGEKLEAEVEIKDIEEKLPEVETPKTLRDAVKLGLIYTLLHDRPTLESSLPASDAGGDTQSSQPNVIDVQSEAEAIEAGTEPKGTTIK